MCLICKTGQDKREGLNVSKNVVNEVINDYNLLRRNEWIRECVFVCGGVGLGGGGGVWRGCGAGARLSYFYALVVSRSEPGRLQNT